MAEFIDLRDMHKVLVSALVFASLYTLSSKFILQYFVKKYKIYVLIYFKS